MRLGGESKTLVDSLKFDGVDQLETLFSGQGKKQGIRFEEFLYNLIVTN